MAKNNLYMIIFFTSLQIILHVYLVYIWYAARRILGELLSWNDEVTVIIKYVPKIDE